MDHVPSYEQMKHHISDITGVSSIVHPMCKNSCLAFTGPFEIWIAAQNVRNLNCVRTQRDLSKNSTPSCLVQFCKLCGVMHQVRRSSIISNGKLGRSFASFRQTLATSPPTMTFTVVAIISRTSKVEKFKIMILFLCSQSIVPSSMHTNHWTAGFTYGL